MNICYEGILTRISIQEPLYLGDKSIVGILEDPDEGYNTNYRGSSKNGITYTNILFNESDAPKERCLSMFM